MIRYLLEMVLVSGMLTAYYCIALRNRRLHGYNRAFLLGTLVLGGVLPLVSFDWLSFDFSQRPAIYTAWTRMTPASRVVGGEFSWMSAGLVIGGIVSLVLLGITARRVLTIYRLRRQETARRMKGFWFIETDDQRAPFSFFDNLFWQRGQPREDEVHDRILRHELAHIEGRHSWDGLFTQVLCCVFWMNPFFWIIRRELGVVHEFIADAAAGMEGDAEGLARMLLQSVNEGRFLQPEHGFFQSPIKRRLVMLNNQHGSRHRAWRMGLVAPVVLALMVFISCSKDPGAQATDQAKQAKERLDMKIRKQLPEIVIAGLKKKAAAAAAAGMSDLEYKQLMERKMLEVEQQMKAGTLKPAQ
jgi:hypothetical protein